MRYLFITGICLMMTLSVHAQVGRVDITLDTIQVGGDEQHEKMTRMAAHDELKHELIVLRDSINRYLTEVGHTSTDKSVAYEGADINKLTTRIQQLDRLIDQFEKAQADVSLNREAYKILEETRHDFNGIRNKKK